MTRPDLLIETWLPTKELGIESRRENSTGQHPPLNRLHVWWARRPLVASTGAILGSLLPAWSAELAEQFSDHTELATEKDYRQWFLTLCGILGDPVAGRLKIERANEAGERLKDGGYGYKQAYKNSPSVADLNLLHRVLRTTWGRIPTVLDPTAGGGSIPYQAIRYGLPCHANDLNSIAAAVLRAGVELPARYGRELAAEIEQWGKVLNDQIRRRLQLAFELDDPHERVTAYIWARSISCPRTGKPVPLAPNWWLAKDKSGTAIRLVTYRDGVELDQPEFDIVHGDDIDRKVTDSGTITRGKAVSPWNNLVIDGDYIKAEAQAGRMGSILYAVAVRTPKGRAFRTPTQTDLDAISRAEPELKRLLPEWEAANVLPDEVRFIGPADRSANYGILNGREMFSPRQLLVHGTFVEEYRKLIPEVRAAIEDQDRAEAVLALLAITQNKGVNWNALLSSWNVGYQSMRSVFDRHDFAFKWTYAEFEGARELYQWALNQITNAYTGLTELLPPNQSGGLGDDHLIHPVPGPVTVSQGNAGDLPQIESESVELVCIDPPYYDNVMYAELADFFYVWEKRTLGHLWPELFEEELTNKDDEAVKNDARFAHAGRRKKELATLDYERKMTAIFEESRRVLTDNGVMTVMFTHKKAEAWDTLGRSLLEAGFTIEASWPVPTEFLHSLHQAKKNAAASTIFLVCRKRAARSDDHKVFFDSIEADVRYAAREAYSELTKAGFDGVDRLLATYGPALSVLSKHWPVYSSEPDESGQSRLLRPEEALLTAQEEVVRLQRSRLVASNADFDPITDFWLLAWDTFSAREFPFDEARKLCLAVGGVDIDDLPKAKILTKKSGTVVLTEPGDRFRRDAESDLPGVNRDRVIFPALIDALHTAIYVVDLDGSAAARTWLEQRHLTTDGRFRALVEAALQAVPRVKTQGELSVEEAGLLEKLVNAAFADMTIPEDKTVVFQPSLLDE